MADQKHGYDNFDIQTVRVTMDVGQGIGPGSTLFENFHRIEPVGGLARDEVAELVGVARSITAHGHVTDVADPAYLHTFWETSFDSKAHITPSGTEATVESDVDGVTGVNAEVADKVDVDILSTSVAAYSSNFSDDTNGNGGGATSLLDWEVYPYREWYGEGPTTDRHDEIFYHAELATNGSASGEVDVIDQYVWDVREC